MTKILHFTQEALKVQQNESTGATLSNAFQVEIEFKIKIEFEIYIIQHITKQSTIQMPLMIEFY